MPPYERLKNMNNKNIDSVDKNEIKKDEDDNSTINKNIKNN